MGLIPLLVLILVLAIVGWLLFTYVIPIIPAGLLRNIAIVVIVVIICLILLGAVGIGTGIKL